MEELPIWYRSVLKIGQAIKGNDLVAARTELTLLHKEALNEAPTLLPTLSQMTTVLAKDPLDEDSLKLLDTLYITTLNLSQLELKATDADRISNEEEIIHDLENLHKNIKTSWRIVWNYWRDAKAGDYQEWLRLHDKIKVTPLTRNGRLRLLAKHQFIGNQILPTFGKMIVQLWPLAALWLLQKIGPVILDKAVRGAIESRQRKKKLQDLQEKIVIASSKTGKSSDFFRPKSPTRRR